MPDRFNHSKTSNKIAYYDDEISSSLHKALILVIDQNSVIWITEQKIHNAMVITLIPPRVHKEHPWSYYL